MLIVGSKATITKSVDQIGSIGKAKDSYEVTVGERRVDYVLSPQLVLEGDLSGVAAKGETVTITDTLPKGVAITTDTKYYLGGTYVTDDTPYGGSLVGGTELPLADGYPQYNADGTTTLQWVLKDVVAGEPMEKIHFSAVIGTAGVEETDVKNNDQYTNTVTIHAENDGRSIHKDHGNLSTYTIKIIKLGQSLLSKMVEEPIIEMGDMVDYIITHNNTSSKIYDNYKLLDILPANNDKRGSKFDGRYTAKIVIDTTNAGGDTGTALELYTSMDDSLVGKTANKVNTTGFGFPKIEDGEIGSNETKTFTLSPDTTAILIVGKLDAHDTYTVHVELTLKDHKVGNIYANDATAAFSTDSYILAPTVAAITIQRTIKSVAWYDANANGIRENNEELLKGIKVILVDSDDPAAEIYDVFGKKVEAVNTDANGAYSFTNLPEGNYKVRFESNGEVFSIGNYILTDKNQGNNNTINSKADGETDGEGKLAAGVISGIALPAKEQVSAYGYTSAYNDIGFYGGIPAEVVLDGNKAMTGDKTAGEITEGLVTFTITEAAANNQAGYTGLPTGAIQVSAGGRISLGTLKFLRTGTYQFVISEVLDGKPGYQYDVSPVTVNVTVTYNQSKGCLEAKTIKRNAEKVIGADAPKRNRVQGLDL